MTPAELKEIRKKIGLSQEKMAAKVGITVSTFQKWENGAIRILPKREKVIRALLK